MGLLEEVDNYNKSNLVKFVKWLKEHKEETFKILCNEYETWREKQ